MAEFYKGTIGTLSNLIAQEKQAKLQKETPQYQAALFNLMQAKKGALAQQTLLNQLSGAAVEDIPRILGRAGDIDPYLTQQKNIGVERKSSMDAAEKKFDNMAAFGETYTGYTQQELEQVRLGKLPVKGLAEGRIKLRQKPPTSHISINADGEKMPVEQRQALINELKETNLLMYNANDPTEIDVYANKRDDILRNLGFTEEQITSLSKRGAGKLKVFQEVSNMTGIPVKQLMNKGVEQKITIGSTVDGYRYLGGDTSNPNNWEKVN